MKGKVIIIPDEKQIDEEKFEMQITEDDGHFIGYQVFSDIHKLGYQFTENDQQIAPLEIASAGHLSIKTVEEESILIFYIPEIVTKRQINYIKENTSKFQEYQIVGSYSIRKVDKDMYIDEKMDFNDTLNEIKRKYNMNLEHNNSKIL